MDKISQVKQLIGEINRLHHHFSKDYFEQGKIEKINLSKTIRHVPVSHIYKYRLTLHESINDYLMTADIDIKYFYRVKTRESIDDKIQRYSAREDQYPVNNWLNDIFGARIILTTEEIDSVIGSHGTACRHHAIKPVGFVLDKGNGFFDNIAFIGSVGFCLVVNGFPIR